MGITTSASLSESDPPGKEGLAHLVEHLLFNSTLSDEEGAPRFGEKLAELKKDMLDMPRHRPNKRDRNMAILPRSAFPSGSSEPEPDEDDEDEE